MPAIGKITATRVGDDMVYTDESGASYMLPGYAVETGIELDIDPRIDLTQPIWEQVKRLDAEDRRVAEATAA